MRTPTSKSESRLSSSEQHPGAQVRRSAAIEFEGLRREYISEDRRAGPAPQPSVGGEKPAAGFGGASTGRPDLSERRQRAGRGQQARRDSGRKRQGARQSRARRTCPGLL